MKRRFKFFWVFAVALLAVGFLVSSGMQETMVYSVTARELLANPAKFKGGGVRLEGAQVVDDGDEGHGAPEPGAVVPPDDGRMDQFILEP